jgi:hypothetical protein
MNRATKTVSPPGERGHKPGRWAVTDNGGVACGDAAHDPEPRTSASLDLDLLLYERAALQPDDG